MIPARPKARPGDLVARIGQHGEGQLLRLLRGQGIRLAPPGRWRPGRCRARPARPGWPRGVSREVPPRAASARSGMALSTSARALMPLASGGRSALALGFADAEYQLGYADVGVGAGVALIWHRQGPGEIVMPLTPHRGPQIAAPGRSNALLPASRAISGRSSRRVVTGSSVARPSPSAGPPASGRTDSTAARGCRRLGGPVPGRLGRR